MGSTSVRTEGAEGKGEGDKGEADSGGEPTPLRAGKAATPGTGSRVVVRVELSGAGLGQVGTARSRPPSARFEAHEKLMNFMFPVPGPTPGVDVDMLLQSLFK